jgi:alginate O-acetyltransferase complex protein AlgI
VWALTGLWHGASWNFVLWGLYYFVFLVIEKFLIRMKKQPTGLWRIPRTVYTLVVVLFGWMLFYYTDLSRLGVALGGIFTLNGNRFWDMAAQTQLMGNLFFLVVACVACTPVIPALGRWFEGRRKTLTDKPNGLAAVAVTVYDAVCALLPVALVCLSVLALVGDSYNPFLYFQF